MSEEREQQHATLDQVESSQIKRKGLAHFGLQGKLIVTFMSLITVALGSSCWLFASQSGQQLSVVISEQARLVAYTLALAAEPSMAAHQKPALTQIGRGLLNRRNILYVAFLDAKKQPLVLANRYADFAWKDVTPATKECADEHDLRLVHPENVRTFGDYVEVFAPIVGRPLIYGPKHQVIKQGDEATLGWALVGVSLDGEMAQLNQVKWVVAGVGAASALFSFPIAYMIVYSIFKPIRQLVVATQQMASGRLDIRVEIDRDDLIGDLAMSFVEMVGQVRRQREDLAFTNRRLADANEQLESANQQLASANQDLEKKVHMRTAQLESSNSRLSNEIAEKEDFLRAVSHDLNAPLRNISGMVTMLLMKHKTKFEEEVVHRLERIQKNVQVESDLISELLELSRIKTRRQKLEMVDVEAIVRDLSGVLEEDLRSKQITLSIDNSLPPMYAERGRLRQVFQNLIDNAIKYMGEGEVKEIHVGGVLRGEEAEFYVRDTGIGIEPEDIGKVFHIFRRGRSAAVQNVAGKGVGLSSVKSIIETYSGRIWVESKVGEGTTFRFTVVAKQPEPSVAAAETTGEAATETPRSGSGIILKAA